MEENIYLQIYICFYCMKYCKVMSLKAFEDNSVLFNMLHILYSNVLLIISSVFPAFNGPFPFLA